MTEGKVKGGNVKEDPGGDKNAYTVTVIVQKQHEHILLSMKFNHG